MTGLLVLAFGAGLLAPINPCGFGLLPAMLTTLAPAGDRDAPGLPARLVAGLRAGLALTVGFTATFTVIGLALTAGLRSLITVVPWLAVALGIVLALIGIGLLTGRQLPLRLPSRHPTLPGRDGTHGTGRIVAFGAGYAIASASCTLAVLLAVVTQAAATSLPGIVAVFTAYAAGSATLLISLAVLAAATSTLLARHLQRAARYAGRITGAVLAASGIYLLVYWLPPLLGTARPGDGGLGALAGHAATAIREYQIPVVLAAAVLIGGVVLAALLAHRRDTTARTGSATEATGTGGIGADCCAPDVTDQPTPPKENSSW
ncbi:cytochrome c biogenesis CcdA family protein [Pseudonocardia dioxanivorans]|uniref:cytochrome c biogenesis CcdA family protein n=1 Tax=Pseudonocardia dioxanivorans TaxID=240495 RepID=UPI000CD30D27|nr:cytochrome c biogenesis protein CcdA [Pseudonocardia dioxanivorans]